MSTPSGWRACSAPVNPLTWASGDDRPRPVIHNDRARDELGWRPRPAETTIVDTVESLRDRGELRS